MASKNLHFDSLFREYNLSSKIHKTVLEKIDNFKKSNPKRKVFSMTFGYTSQSLSPTIVQKLIEAAYSLGDSKNYISYEDVAGKKQLRELICSHYYQPLGVELDPSEIFIIDGAQSALGNIQELFSVDNIVAVQNPTYPYIIESNILAGRNKIMTLDCNQENDFLPEVPPQKADLIYLCFPNNPTGAVTNFKHLNSFVSYANDHQSTIIFDAVYSLYTQTQNTPRSIYEIKNSKSCSIEINSLSKVANFTGLRLGWCVVPHDLTVSDSSPGELNQMWRTRHSVKFWGASNLAQMAGIAALSEQGQKESMEIVDFYLKNASLLKKGLETHGLNCFGGVNSPYLWVKAPNQYSSWQFFDWLLEHTGIAGMPGCLFGSCGEGYLRLSALGHREEIKAAIENLANLQLSYSNN
ncbi:MAG: LL-diaminopimelate aminotransferase [Cyanobacteriota bacterium]|nr:LL-diaminopimelate aminotransferase [Cyanobacteriota bacterium]